MTHAAQWTGVHSHPPICAQEIAELQAQVAACREVLRKLLPHIVALPSTVALAKKAAALAEGPDAQKP
jgi:hypothetical protein